MSWYFERHVVPSPVNGEIVCTRSFGAWRTSVNGTMQSGWFIRRLWRNALRRLSPLFHPNRILLLGLGTGSAIESIRSAYPKATFDAIEIDEEMIRLIRRFGFVSEKMMPSVIIGDVCTVLPQIREAYDLILIDLFNGSDVPPKVSTAEFFLSVADHLSPSGSVVVNVYRDARAVAAMREIFSVTSEWTDLTNTMLMAQRPADPLFVPYRSCDAYLLREFGNRSGFHVEHDKEGVPSVEWSVGPFRFERRTSDKQPNVNERLTRIQLWQPIRAMQKPAGWRVSPLPFTIRQTGYIDIRREAYWEEWGSHAKRHRSSWVHQRELEITECSGNDVREMTFPSRFQQRVRESVQRHGNLVRVFLTHSRHEPQKIVAALAVVDVPEIFTSIHLASFILPSIRKTSVGVGMICAWIESCRKKQFRFADLDIVWTPGDPNEWRGYSRFKLHFKPQLVRYPKPLFRI